MTHPDDGEEWVRVGNARHVGEAALFRHGLEVEGIEVRTRGEHLPSIAGELPLSEAGVELWVPSPHRERAAAILDELMKPSASDGSTTCPRCGEQNPADFAECWKCQAAIDPEAARAEPPAPADRKT
jgi:hypothetical protein